MHGKVDNCRVTDSHRPLNKTKFLEGEGKWERVPGFGEKCEEWVEKVRQLES